MLNPKEIFLNKYKEDKINLTKCNLKNYKLDIDIKEENYRFVILSILIFQTLLSGFSWPTYSAISSELNYNTNISYLNNSLLTALFPVTYALINFSTCYIIDNYSLRYSSLISATFLLFGFFFKVFTLYSFYFCLIGQFLCGVAAPFVLNSSINYIELWFREEIRVFILSVVYASNSLGIVLCFIYSNLVFNTSNKYNYNNFEHNVFSYTFYPFIASFLILLFSIFFSKTKPKFYSSLSNYLKAENIKDTYKSIHVYNSLIQKYNFSKNLISTKGKFIFLYALDLIFLNKTYKYLLFNYTIIIGFFTYFYSLIQQIFSVYNLNSSYANSLASFSNFFTLLQVVVFGYLGMKVKRFKLCLFLSVLLIIVGYICLFILLEINYFRCYNLEIKSIENFILHICFILLSLVSCTYLIGIEYACEIAYPISESIIGGTLLASSQLYGFIMSIIMSYTISYVSIYVFHFVVIFGMILSLLCIYNTEGKPYIIS